MARPIPVKAAAPPGAGEAAVFPEGVLVEVLAEAVGAAEAEEGQAADGELSG
ncbi:MAG TPA: hypothetical protein VJA17_04445 [Candidatus Omnitrophota bacterium]|nr:hypothetical protein [Candidatus Omnitrophota bacterium]